jgi:hypothetical protein
MFKLARKNYLREIFSGGSGCTGDCGQGRRCTCDPDREESAGKPTNGEAQLPIGKTMTRDDVIRMAREAGFADGVVDIVGFEGFANFAALVAAHEREECAKVANAWQTDVLNPQYHCDCATAIRSRREK